MIPSAFAKAFTALFASSISLLAEEFDIDDMTEMPLLSVTRSRTSIVCADEILEEASLISRKAFCPMSTSRLLLSWSRDAASSLS